MPMLGNTENITWALLELFATYDVRSFNVSSSPPSMLAFVPVIHDPYSDIETRCFVPVDVPLDFRGGAVALGRLPKLRGGFFWNGWSTECGVVGTQNALGRFSRRSRVIYPSMGEPYVGEQSVGSSPRVGPVLLRIMPAKI